MGSIWNGVRRSVSDPMWWVAALVLVLGSGCWSRQYFVPPQPDLMERPVVAVSIEDGCSVGSLDYRVNPRLAQAIEEGAAPGRVSLPVLDIEPRPARRIRRSLIVAGAGALMYGLGFRQIVYGKNPDPGIHLVFHGSLTFLGAGTVAIVSGVQNRDPMSFDESLDTDSLVVPYRSRTCSAFTPEQWEEYTADNPAWGESPAE